MKISVAAILSFVLFPMIIHAEAPTLDQSGAPNVRDFQLFGRGEYNVSDCAVESRPGRPTGADTLASDRAWRNENERLQRVFGTPITVGATAYCAIRVNCRFEQPRRDSRAPNAYRLTHMTAYCHARVATASSPTRCPTDGWSREGVTACVKENVNVRDIALIERQFRAGDVRQSRLTMDRPQVVAPAATPIRNRLDGFSR